MGSAFNGSEGVDAEDIMNIPQIDMGSFMFFPDQFKYGPDDPNLPPFNNTVNQGLSWITMHAELSRQWVTILAPLSSSLNYCLGQENLLRCLE
jgi:mannan endo-1,4-beta-mannosidase